MVSTFTYEGREIPFRPGDTVASALYRTGLRIFSRSFKYHRPRGLYCLSGRCSHCLMTIDGLPNQLACRRPAEARLRVGGQHAWPSVKRDLFRGLDAAGYLFPVGFYYKTFIRPRRLWPFYEGVLRRFSGLGRLDPKAVAPRVRQSHEHGEVAVVGGGPAGLAAALAAADAGRDVVLIEADPALGGHLRWTGWTPEAEALRERVECHPGVRVWTGATAFGLYEDNLLGVVRDLSLVELRASQIVVATGRLERPLLFEDNDLPGIMLASGALRLLSLHGIRPGSRAVVAGDGPWARLTVDRLQRAGLDVVAAAAVRAAEGRNVLRRVRLVREGREVSQEADLLCMAAGFTPEANLLYQAGARWERHPTWGGLVPSLLPSGIHAAGHVRGVEGLDALLEDGRRAGEGAAGGGPSRGAASAGPLSSREEPGTHRPTASPVGESAGEPSQPHGSGRRAFVCLCEDVTAKDLAAAWDEGFTDLEILKRYTTVTMGPCQGRLCQSLADGLRARLAGEVPEQSGLTTARPPALPVELGMLAGPFEHPVRHTPMHHLHLELGAKMTDLGEWRRPRVYTSVQEECRAVREAVGLIDVSSLGKLELTGRDALWLLHQVYTGKYAQLVVGKARYVMMLDESGAILDDGTVSRVTEDHYLLTTTTGGVHRVEEWLRWWAVGRCAHVTDVTSALAAVNLAGPRAPEVLAGLVDLDPRELPPVSATPVPVAGVPSLILRLGFVSPFGYEIHIPSVYGEHLWRAILEAGAPFGIRPFGVDAQRVLRLEMGHLIVGQDTDALSNPLWAGSGWAVKLDKEDFSGRRWLARKAELEPPERLVGFVLEASAPVPAEGAAVVLDGRPAGRVTSSALSPTLGRPIGLAWVPGHLAGEGSTFQVRVSGRPETAQVVKPPFYREDAT